MTNCERINDVDQRRGAMADRCTGGPDSVHLLRHGGVAIPTQVPAYLMFCVRLLAVVAGGWVFICLAAGVADAWRWM